MANTTNAGPWRSASVFGKPGRGRSRFRARRSRNSGFTELFAERRYIQLSLRRLGVRDADIEDMTQEIFLRAYRQLDSFDQSRPARAWLLGFALRMAADYRRLARHRRELVGLSWEADQEHRTSASVEDELIRAEKRMLVNDALERLNPEKGIVLRLYGLENQEMSTVAAILRVPLHTAYSRLRHGRHELGRALRALRV
jgi:RNA polymerase sigma-70 factor, ECF subfamily